MLSENATMGLEVGDLHKKLEMAELMIQQFSNQTGAPDANQQLRMALGERDQLGAQLTQVSESLQHLRAERDQYVEKLKEEGSVWQERVQQLLEQFPPPFPCGSVAQWIAHWTSSGGVEGIQRLWVRVPPESFVLYLTQMLDFKWNILIKTLISTINLSLMGY
ncbi:hypothetical protein FKM82_005590 [Ascaphus truei]